MVRAAIYGGAVAALIASHGLAYWQGGKATQRAIEARLAADNQATSEAIDDAPTFNPGDPAARKRLCQLLGISDCTVQRDQAEP